MRFFDAKKIHSYSLIFLGVLIIVTSDRIQAVAGYRRAPSISVNYRINYRINYLLNKAHAVSALPENSNWCNKIPIRLYCQLRYHQNSVCPRFYRDGIIHCKCMMANYSVYRFYTVDIFL